MRGSRLKTAEIRTLALIAKQTGIVIEVVERDRTIRFNTSSDLPENDEQRLDQELAEFDRKNGYKST